jgi:Uma2 family endonuclease
LVPDLAGWKRERLPLMPAAAYFELRPDWVCEILSPSTAGIDRVRKARLYAMWETPFMWLIEPVERFIETYRLHGRHWERTGAWEAGERVVAPPFESVEFETTDWFPPVASQ